MLWSDHPPDWVPTTMTVVGLSRSDVRGQILHLAQQDRWPTVKIDSVADDLDTGPADDVVGEFFADARLFRDELGNLIQSATSSVSSTTRRDEQAVAVDLPTVEERSTQGSITKLSRASRSPPFAGLILSVNQWGQLCAKQICRP